MGSLLTSLRGFGHTTPFGQAAAMEDEEEELKKESPPTPTPTPTQLLLPNPNPNPNPTKAAFCCWLGYAHLFIFLFLIYFLLHRSKPWWWVVWWEMEREREREGEIEQRMARLREKLGGGVSFSAIASYSLVWERGKSHSRNGVALRDIGVCSRERREKEKSPWRRTQRCRSGGQPG